MGGCATKPKVLKGDEGEVPAPAPPPNPAVPEGKEAADVVAAEGEKKVEADELVKDKDVDKAKEVVIDNTIDDHSNKQRSLSNLFKEKAKKGTAESDNTSSEPMKKETLESMLQESPETVKQESLEPEKTEAVEPVTMNQETREPEKPIEPVSGFPGNIESAQSIEAKPAPEATATAAAVNVPDTQYKEKSAGEKKDKTLVAN